MPKKNVDRFGATRLARECEKGDLEAVHSAFSAAPEELNQEDFAGIAPLQKASLNGHADIVEFLLSNGCRTDCESNDRDTPLIDAVENGHLEVVRLLLGKAKVNPHHQNKKGQRAIDVLNDDEDDMKEIEKELKNAMRRETNTLEDDENATGTSEQRTTSRLLYNEFNTETLIEKAGEGDILAVGELLNSNIKPNIACGVAAARGGHYDILSILLASGLKADPDPSKHSETPMLVTIGRGHLKIVKLILEQDSFDPTKRNREGRTYFEISEERSGPKWEQERDLLKAAYDRHRLEHKSPKRNRKEAQSSAAPRPKRRSSPQREHSSSPRLETKRIPLPKSSTTPGAPQKTRGRLISGRELSNQRDAKKRRRQVVDDETASSESDDSPKRTGKPAVKRRSYSEDHETKLHKKPTKALLEKRDSTKRGGGARSEDSDENTRKPLKRPLTKPRPGDGEKSRDPKPTPDAESLDDRRGVKKAVTKARNAEREKSKETKATLHDLSGEDSKTKKLSPAGDTKKGIATAPPEKATTPESVLEFRRQDAQRQAAEAKRKVAQEEAARKAEEMEAARKAEEVEAARKAAEEEANRIAEAEADAKRKADEAVRVAAELEAKRLADEKARQAARLQRLSKLPRVLKRAAELGFTRPLHFSGDEMGISASFLPLYKVALQDIDPSVQADDPWMMSFQAAGILGLPELDLAYLDPPYSEWLRKEVTQQQREIFLRKYDIAQLAQDFRFPMPGDEDFDDGKIQRSIDDARQQFLDMEGLYWIPLESFTTVAKETPPLEDLMDSLCSSKAWPARINEEGKSPGFASKPSFLDVFLEQQPRTNGVGTS
jgi:ankyrin repeat protein